MGNVISFKSKLELNDQDLERSLREVLARHGFPEDAVNSSASIAISLFKESRDVVARGLEFETPDGLDQAAVDWIEEMASKELQLYQSQVASFIQKLIARLALAEAKGASN